LAISLGKKILHYICLQNDTIAHALHTSMDNIDTCIYNQLKT
jgi:hypothetical protein